MKLITVSSLVLAFLSSAIASDLDSRSDIICVHGHDCTTDSSSSRTHTIGKHKIEVNKRSNSCNSPSCSLCIDGVCHATYNLTPSRLRRNVKRNTLLVNCPEESKAKTGEIAQDAVDSNGCTVTVDNRAGTGFASTEKLQQLNGTMDGVQMLKMEYGDEKSSTEEEEEKKENMKNGCPPDCSLCVQGMCRDSAVKKVDAIKEANQEGGKNNSTGASEDKSKETGGEKNSAMRSGVDMVGVISGVAVVGLLSAFL